VIKYIDFRNVLQYLDAGYQGVTIEQMLEGLLAPESPEGEYTVYWPKDSIRVIHGSSYAVAKTMLAILRDPRTRYMGSPTFDKVADLALVRRDLHRQEWATNVQVERDTVYTLDRMLPWDISVSVEFHGVEMSEHGVTYRLDLTTLPET
jgi:hypothetical protein